jgi:hypothetical protein
MIGVTGQTVPSPVPQGPKVAVAAATDPSTEERTALVMEGKAHRIATLTCALWMGSGMTGRNGQPAHILVVLDLNQGPGLALDHSTRDSHVQWRGPQRVVSATWRHVQVSLYTIGHGFDKMTYI